MIHQSYAFEKSQIAIFSAMRELKIAQLLRNSNIRKSDEVSVFKIFEFLILLVFKCKNLFQYLSSKHNDHSISKNAIYNFLSNSSFNWRRFCCLFLSRLRLPLENLLAKAEFLC